jgi:hypothetical protein
VPTVRRTSLLPRQAFVRDASLILVATEGRYTEAAYLELFQSSRLKIVPIPATERDDSAPQHVLGRMNAYVTENRIQWQEGDQCWLMLDVDRWKPFILDAVCREAAQKGYGLAVSNPCFELWLILHFADADPTADADCKAVDARLTTVMGGQGKRHCDPALYTAEALRAATERAQTLPDARPEGQRWPARPGTDVWKLAARLLERGDKQSEDRSQ